MKALLVRFIFPACMLVFGSCGEAPAEEEKRATTRITEETEFANTFQGIPLNPGVVGLYTVPEMLCLTVMDSTNSSGAAESVQRSYAILDQEMRAINAIQNGPYGQISYSNDTANFKYECFVLIAKMPAAAPRRAKIVVLETGRMVAYNYYGPYQQLHTAYAELKTYLHQKKLEQAGPLREHYITDPRVQKDPAAWRTLLLVPVNKR